VHQQGRKWVFGNGSDGLHHRLIADAPPGRRKNMLRNLTGIALTSLPGKFSGLNLLCMEYVGFPLLDPSINIGFDLSAEYAAARTMYDG
jgi:hypothetical protein